MPARRRPSLAAIIILPLTLLAVSVGALAQSRADAAPPVGPQPGSTTATYGDWTLRCETGPASDPAQSFCEVAQTLQAEGKAAPVAQVAFGRPDHGPKLHVIVALPVNVTFPSTVRIGLDGNDSRPLDLDWKRCLPGACFADAVASEEVLARWRVAGGAGRIRYLDAAGREVALPLSWRGLGPALDALGRR